MKELLEKLKKTIYKIDYQTSYDSLAKNEVANAIALLAELEKKLS